MPKRDRLNQVMNCLLSYFTTTLTVHPMLLVSCSSTLFASNNLRNNATGVTSQENSPPHHMAFKLLTIINVKSGPQKLPQMSVQQISMKNCLIRKVSTVP